MRSWGPPRPMPLASQFLCWPRAASCCATATSASCEAWSWFLGITEAKATGSEFRFWQRNALLSSASCPGSWEAYVYVLLTDGLRGAPNVYATEHHCIVVYTHLQG